MIHASTGPTGDYKSNINERTAVEIFGSLADFKLAHPELADQIPPFNPNGDYKNWYDPNPPVRGRTATWPRCLAVDERGNPLAGPDGKPYLEPLSLPASEAKWPNLPDGDVEEYLATGAGFVSFPVAPLAPTEHLEWGDGAAGPMATRAGGDVVVVNDAIPKPMTPAPAGWSVQDRAMLHAIAAKMGVA